ncbi:MAG TPA: gliding motility protein GldM [Chitinophagaceae bacterium]|nr:gliding motility protein GldM [Chitinophagales bacterium]HRX93379.1 gliding motility protein GldM [Chitinophagaceae bacterium]
MALPKEPRQKMINIMYLVLTALLALNVSSEILNAFKTVRRSLENTNNTVSASTATILKSLEEKTLEPQTKERAEIWYPKAQEAAKISKDLYDYIESLKGQIITLAGGKPGTDEPFKEDNLDIVTKLMVKEGKGNDLKKRLEQFSKDLRGLDPAIDSAFKSPFVNLDNPPGRDGKVKDWDIAYFNMVPTVAGLTILSKFQNDIKTAENKVIAECHKKVGEVKVIFDSYAAIVGQNSNYLMPGQEIEIKAGIGAFSKAAQPTITIGGSNVPIGEEGFALYKGQAGGVGSRSIPVKISYMNQVTGKMEILEKNVEYVVGSANASIALDKMNVLYIGVDNPVTIAASGGGDDKVQASISGGGGSLTRAGNGKYVVRVNSVTDDCKITVSVEGKVAGVAQFRVRTIPDPVASVGGVMSNENMIAGQFRAQSGVSAAIKDFPFDLRYTVVSFTLTADNDEGYIDEAPCQGNTWSPKALSIIRNLKTGRTVTIDEIRAQGPDGRVRKIPGLVYYIK